MIRATTPKHLFIFDIDPNEYERVLITYRQGDYIILEKEKEDLTIEEIEETQECGCEPVVSYRAWFQLTQEETNMFYPNKPVKVQVRVLTTSGEALASEEFTVNIRDVLNDEVLV